MSSLTYTPAVLGQIAADFSRNRIGPVTVQFFDQLFRRVGGFEAPTNTEINNIMLGDTIVSFDFGAHPEAVPSAVDVAPVGTSPQGISEGLGPAVPFDSDVGGNVGPWP